MMECVVCSNAENFTKLSPEYCEADNWLCEVCGLVFIPREMNEKHDFYKAGGYYAESVNFAARKFMVSRHLLLQIAKERVGIIEELAAVKLNRLSVLDVGCGYGEALGYLKLHRNCEVLGVEPSPEQAKVGEEMFGINIAPMLFEEYEFSEVKFDLIMCNHALEHVVDPRRVLQLIAARLKTNGILYLEVPNVMWPSGGFELKDFLYEEHLQTFSSMNLGMLLDQAGYDIVTYCDKNFLRFVCVARYSDRSVEKLIVPKLTASSIKFFLAQYKEEYTVFKRLNVYFGKAAYVMRLIVSKTIDSVMRESK